MDAEYWTERVVFKISLFNLSLCGYFEMIVRFKLQLCDLTLSPIPNVTDNSMLNQSNILRNIWFEDFLKIGPPSPITMSFSLRLKCTRVNVSHIKIPEWRLSGLTTATKTTTMPDWLLGPGTSGHREISFNKF